MTTKPKNSKYTYAFVNYGSVTRDGKPDFRLFGKYSNAQEYDALNTRLTKEIIRLHGDNWEYKNGVAVALGAPPGSWTLFRMSPERDLVKSAIEEADSRLYEGIGGITRLVGLLDAYGDKAEVQEAIKAAYHVLSLLLIVLAYRLEPQSVDKIVVKNTSNFAIEQGIIDIYRADGMGGVLKVLGLVEEQA